MIEGVVFAALKNISAILNSNGTPRCYPAEFPQTVGPNGEITLATALPAIRYTVVGTVPVVDVCGTDDGSTDDVRVQIDCVAMTHGAAVALRDLVRAAMDGLDPPCVRDNGFWTKDEATRTYRTTEDFIFYPSSEATS